MHLGEASVRPRWTGNISSTNEGLCACLCVVSWSNLHYRDCSFCFETMSCACMLQFAAAHVVACMQKAHIQSAGPTYAMHSGCPALLCVQFADGAGCVAADAYTLCLIAAAVVPAGSAHGMMYSPATCSVYIKNLPEQVGGFIILFSTHP